MDVEKYKAERIARYEAEQRELIRSRTPSPTLPSSDHSDVSPERQGSTSRRSPSPPPEETKLPPPPAVPVPTSSTSLPSPPAILPPAATTAPGPPTSQTSAKRRLADGTEVDVEAFKAQMIAKYEKELQARDQAVLAQPNQVRSCHTSASLSVSLFVC